MSFFLHIKESFFPTVWTHNYRMTKFFKHLEPFFFHYAISTSSSIAAHKIFIKGFDEKISYERWIDIPKHIHISMYSRIWPIRSIIRVKDKNRHLTKQTSFIIFSVTIITFALKRMTSKKEKKQYYSKGKAVTIDIR